MAKKSIQEMEVEAIALNIILRDWLLYNLYFESGGNVPVGGEIFENDLPLDESVFVNIAGYPFPQGQPGDHNILRSPMQMRYYPDNSRPGLLIPGYFVSLFTNSPENVQTNSSPDQNGQANGFVENWTSSDYICTAATLTNPEQCLAVQLRFNPGGSWAFLMVGNMVESYPQTNDIGSPLVTASKRISITGRWNESINAGVGGFEDLSIFIDPLSTNISGTDIFPVQNSISGEGGGYALRLEYDSWGNVPDGQALNVSCQWLYSYTTYPSVSPAV